MILFCVNAKHLSAKSKDFFRFEKYCKKKDGSGLVEIYRDILETKLRL